ncbi:VOC family protein [Lentzea nigeriaca]|uniref:VOC family protein n=1 Tax=Lentzea nigeriaca TaxID=1128665 RepID=UPI00195DE4FB|nr:VOC family protein [Lentzea nigeriaca]MBM7857066.1 putative enzyme related to lactoylglutathione lyase [Lentzea nigeriaca]
MITTDFVPGAPAWIELGSPDRDATAAFYGRVLGWGLGDQFTHEGRTVAGHAARETGAWTIHFAVADADQAAQAVVAAGGTIHDRTMADPQGAEFGVWPHAGLDVVSVPGALTWLELHSPADASFYRTVFSWDAITIPGAPGEFVRPAGTGAGRLFGAVVGDSEAYWLPYFEVTDVDQAAGAAEEVVEPYELDGVGRIAVLVDPFGARFGVMRSVTS